MSYKITMSTNLRRARKNVNFRQGETTCVVYAGLAEQDAKDRMVMLLKQDIPEVDYIETVEEYVKCYLAYNHFFEFLDGRVDENEDEYFEKTKKRWMLFYNRNHVYYYDFPDMFSCPGFYLDGRIVMKGTGQYEHNGYVYKMEEDV